MLIQLLKQMKTGNTTYKVLGKTATDNSGNEITDGSQGRRYCRKDTKKIKQKKVYVFGNLHDKPH